MAETSIRISLELADKAAQNALSDFIKSGTKAEKGLDKVGKTGARSFDDIAISVGKATGIFDIFTGNLAANIATKALEGATRAASALFNTFIVEGVKAAQESENSISALNIALQQSGIYSKETSQEFQAFAKEIQRTTKFEDDAVIKNAALIQSLAQLDKDGLKRATRAAVDLAAGLAGKGLSVEAASEAVAKAANGNITVLSKLGLEIRKGRNDAETFANTLAAVEAQFGGSAVAAADTYAGAIAQASNNFGDLTEEIGNFIIKNPGVIAGIKSVASITAQWTDATSANGMAISSLVNSGLNVMINVLAGVVAGLDGVARAAQTTFAAVRALGIAIEILNSPFNAIENGLESTIDDLGESFKNLTDDALSLTKAGEGALGSLANDLLKVKDAINSANAPMATITGSLGEIGKNLTGIQSVAKAGSGQFFNSITGAVEPINLTRRAIAAVSAETTLAQANLKSFALELVKQGDSAKAGAAGQIEALQLKNEVELAKNQELLNQKLISETEFLIRKQEIEAAFDLSKGEIETQKNLNEIAQLDLALAQKLISNQQYLEAKKQQEINHDLALAKIDADKLKRETANKKTLSDAEEKLNAQKVRAAGETFSNLSSLMRTESKELFEIGKAAAIASATINTYEGATKALAQGGIFGAALAASVVVAGLVQVANIAKTGPSFEDGGIVPGSSFSGDKISANVNSGEMILNRSQQKALFDIANSGGGADSSRTEALLTRLISAIESQPVVVNVGGKTIVDTLRSELNSGRSFA